MPSTEDHDSRLGIDIAYHEAGHIVAGRALGLEVEGVSIVPD